MPARVVMLLENNPYPQDTRVRNEAETLARAGFPVTVLAPRAAGEARCGRVSDVEVKRYRCPRARGTRLSYAVEYGVAHLQLTSRALGEIVRGAQILHFHGPPDTLVIAGALARLAGRKVVFDLHDSGPELFAAKFGAAPLAPALLRMAQRAAIRCSSHVIVTNETQRALVQRSSTKPADAVSVVRNGPRSAEFRELPSARPGRLAAPRLVYVGALDTQDGVLELPQLLTAPVLRQARLCVVGDGPLKQVLVARCRRAGVAERVTFTGQVPHAQVPRLIADADIGIDPAPATELNHGSTMIKILEYMRAGRPVVAYELRETRRSAGAAALYARAGDVRGFAALIADLAGDAERRLRMGRAARERARGLGWEHSAETLVRAYRHLTGTEAERGRIEARATQVRCGALRY